MLTIFFSFLEEGESGLKGFLHFMTGAEELPPLGMPCTIQAIFYAR